MQHFESGVYSTLVLLCQDLGHRSRIPPQQHHAPLCQSSQFDLGTASIAKARMASLESDRLTDRISPIGRDLSDQCEWAYPEALPGWG